LDGSTTRETSLSGNDARRSSFTDLSRPPPARLLSPEDILRALHLPPGFEVLVSEVRPREADGEVTALDSVVLVRRTA